MAKVMGVLKTIPKNGRNKQQGYDFVTDSDLLDAIRPALAQHKIALVADMIEVVAGERPTKVLMRFRLCCGETGAVVESRWWGQSNMPGDKALTAAAVLAQKYFLKATFAISTGDESDDPDAHASEGKPQPAQLCAWQSQPAASRPPTGIGTKTRPFGSPDAPDRKRTRRRTACFRAWTGECSAARLCRPATVTRSACAPSAS